QDLAGGTRSLALLKGKPAVVLLWSVDATAARAALETLGRGAQELTRAGIGSIAIAVEAPADQPSLRHISSGATPVVIATPEVSLSYAILDRKSTRLNSSHSQISYAVFCLKKKKKK